MSSDELSPVTNSIRVFKYAHRRAVSANSDGSVNLAQTAPVADRATEKGEANYMPIMDDNRDKIEREFMKAIHQDYGIRTEPRDGREFLEQHDSPYNAKVTLTGPLCNHNLSEKVEGTVATYIEEQFPEQENGRDLLP